MKVIFFDFDGVIGDTKNFCKGILKQIGLNVSNEDFLAHHDGNVFVNPRINFTKQSVDDYFHIYTNDIEKNKSFFKENDIKDLSKKYMLFIISSNFGSAINKFLYSHNLNYFKEVLGMDFEKSKIKKMEYILNKYNIAKDDSVFVTDTLGDVLEANKLGINTIAVSYGFHNETRLKKANPYKIVSSVEELLLYI